MHILTTIKYRPSIQENMQTSLKNTLLKNDLIKKLKKKNTTSRNIHTIYINLIDYSLKTFFQQTENLMRKCYAMI